MVNAIRQTKKVYITDSPAMPRLCPRINYSTWSIRLKDAELQQFQSEARRRGVPQAELFRQWLRAGENFADLKEIMVQSANYN